MNAAPKPACPRLAVPVPTSTPKVSELRDRLADLIGTLPEGSLLPPERELAARWRVARMTLRRAMDELVSDDLLVRRHGVGTFTTRPKVQRQLAMTSFSAEMRRRGMRPGSRVLEVRECRSDHALARRLRIPAGDPVVEFARLRLADDKPMAVERTTIAKAYVPGLRRDELDGSWYELLAARYGLRVTGGTCRLEPVMPDRRSAAWLGIPMTQPCLASTVTSLDARGHVIDVGASVFRGDRYAILAELRPGEVR